jgi:uncharacterized alpha-E superfamily protein
MARENARSLRHVTPVEAWKQINMLHGEVASLKTRQITLPRLSALCETVRLGCLTHQGMVDASWYRDEVWLFHRLGCELERADQTTRLIDVKYYQLATAGGEEDYTPPDIVWWNSLLRSASSYHAFRRRHSVTAGPSDAAAFLLYDSDCPRSVRTSVLAAADRLRELEEDYDAAPSARLGRARDGLVTSVKRQDKVEPGPALHRALDDIQVRVIKFADALSRRYFSVD